MSRQPHVVLAAIFNPHNSPIETMSQIRAHANDEMGNDLALVSVFNANYLGFIADDNEDGYADKYQIDVNSGAIVFINHIVHGYGSSMDLDNFKSQAENLEIWAKIISRKFECDYTIKLLANYW